MPVEFLEYKKNGGVITLKIEITNVPIWNYSYKEDRLHENSTAQSNPKEHTLGRPHELKRPQHRWNFLLTNPANFDISASLKMKWYQEINGVITQIHSWENTAVDIKARKGEHISDQIILFPS